MAEAARPIKYGDELILMSLASSDTTRDSKKKISDYRLLPLSSTMMHQSQDSW